MIRNVNKNNGFLSGELAVVLFILAVVAIYLFSKSEPTRASFVEAQTVDQVNTIIQAARNAKVGRTDGYASLTIAILSTSNELNMGDGKNRNPADGDWDISDSTRNQIILKGTNFETSLCSRIAAKLATVATATCTSGTIQVTVY